MKICTNIEQSKKLIELGIDVNTADMYWSIEEIPFLAFPVNDIVTDWKYAEENGMLPAWSLSALLGVLPDEVGDNHFLTLEKESNQYCCCYEDINGNSSKHTFADNPVDACVEMIIRLSKNGLI